jgi:membrane-bound metal-dependent hydrolase YbcI (DUF457 family)
MSASQKQQVRAALHETLYRLEYAAFEQVMKRLLYQSGYLSVHLIGRNHQPGHTPTGGLDLAARSMTELTSVLTIAQVKQYRGVVPRRFVDELRGAMLRLGAEQGLLLTLSRFSQAAHTAAKSKVAPVKLIEGAEILDLLFAYRIGVSVKNRVWDLDRAWLDTLPKRAIGTYDKTTSPKNQRALPTGQNQTEKLQSLPGKEQPQEATNPFNDESRTMTWSTHLMAGLNSLWILEAFPTEQVFSNENFAIAVAAAALGSLLPDLDAAESKIKHLQIGGVKPFLLPSQLIHRQTGHRSLLHSLMALVYVALLGIVIAACLGPIAAFALWLGYATHLLADACTRAGIPLLYPRMRRFHLLPKPLRIVTGSQAEDVIFALLALSVIALLLRHLLAS